MQKKLIALAVASALSVPAVALADTGNVTIYGNANVSYDFIDSGATGIRSQRVSSNVSNIGLKGSEDLGGGLTAVWQVEQLVDIGGAGSSVINVGTTAPGGILDPGHTHLYTTAPASNGFGTMNTFVGLSSGTMGTVVLGRHDTPYKIATRGLDVFGNGIADNRSLMGQSSTSILLGTPTAFDGRQPNVIAYISPAMAGLTVAVGHVNLNQTLGTSQSMAGDVNSGAWSLAGLYGNGPFFASLAYEKHDLESAVATLAAIGVLPAPQPGAEEKAWKLGLGYTQDAFNVGFAYEKTSDNLAAGADALGHKAWTLGGKYNISASDAVKAAYTKTGNLGAAANTDANQFALGYDHAMSKRTTVYALYTRLNNGAAAGYQLGGGNASSVSDSLAGNALAAAGSDPSAVSIGLKHSF